MQSPVGNNRYCLFIEMYIVLNLNKTSYRSDMPYTWCYQDFPIICSHIDHIRSTNPGLELDQIIIPGSDHTGFYGKIFTK